MNGRPIRQEDEAAIRQLIEDMQEGQNTKKEELFASALAHEHDYVAVNGMFLPNQIQEDNARRHQGLYDESSSSVAGRYG
jgi:thioredoxin-like negative regulator of GroEL